MGKENESRLRWASLISGGGTTMNAIAQSTKSGELQRLIEPVVVISSCEEAAGIKKAQDMEIPVELVLRKDFPAGQTGVNPYGAAINLVLEKYSPDVITLNGFLAMISEEVIDKYKDRIFNQHPGPVPDFGGQGMYGRRVHAAVLIFGRLAKRDPFYTEVVAQRVSPNYDRGRVVKSTKVAVLAKDDVDTLQKSTLPVEHQMQIELLYDVALGRSKEIVYRKPFVEPMELEYLFEAKKIAKLLYPNG